MHLPVLHTDTDVACIAAGPDEYRPRLERLRHRAAATGGYCMDQIIIIIIITVVLTALIHAETARLSGPGCLTKYQDGTPVNSHPDQTN